MKWFVLVLVSGVTFVLGMYLGASGIGSSTTVAEINNEVLEATTTNKELVSNEQTLEAVPAGVQYGEDGTVLLSPDELWAQRNGQPEDLVVDNVNAENQHGGQVYQTWEEAFSAQDEAVHGGVSLNTLTLMEQELEQDLALNGELLSESMVEDSGEPMLDVDTGIEPLASVQSSTMNDIQPAADPELILENDN